MSVINYALCFALILGFCAAATAAVRPLDKPGMAVIVEAGTYTVRGHSVKVASTVELPIAPRSEVVVKNEEDVLSDQASQAWTGGPTLVETTKSSDGTRLPYSLATESVVVQSATAGMDSVRVYAEDKDYKLDHVWGGMSRVDGGAIAKGAKVLVSYSVYLQRVDTVQVSKSGVASIKQGVPAHICPGGTEPDPGCIPLANIYISYHTTAIGKDDIYPLPEKHLSWQDFIKVSGREHLSHTLGLLKSGKPVSVVCWGDSVTEGASPSSHDKCYVELLRSRLKAAYPKAPITLTNAGIGGSNTDSRRDGYEKEVLSYNPDLITVEFVNDIGKGPDGIKRNWAEFISRARQKNPNVEFILITPHNVMPEWMNGFDKSADAMRQAAADNKVALADANNIWINLRALGIPYYTLLANGINHPNDLGHEFFTASLMELLKAER